MTVCLCYGSQSFLIIYIVNRFERIETDTAVPLEPTWEVPRRVEITGPPNPHVNPKEDVTVSVSYKLPPINNGYVYGIIDNIYTSHKNK